MSNTIVDMPKVTQMLDAGWGVRLWKNGMGSYTAQGEHPRDDLWQRAKDGVLAQTVAANKGPDGIDEETLRELNDQDFDNVNYIDTDDFTPEQALTRLAYKVHGEII